MLFTTLEIFRFIEQILIVIAALLVVFDVFLYLNDTKGDTISNIIKAWVFDKYFFLTFVWGVLAGHFFLGVEHSVLGNDWLGLGCIVIVVAVMAYLGIKRGMRMNMRGQLLLLLFGAAFGHLFWSMS